MKTYQNIEELIEDSVNICTEKSVKLCPPFGGNYLPESVTSWAKNFNGQFSVNNSVIAFVTDDKLYSTPYTEGAVQVLRQANFHLTCFYVPFSGWDYPSSRKARRKWNRLLQEAQIDAYEVFEYNCIQYCNQHNIGSLGEKILNNCLQVPNTGIPIRDLYYNGTFYPILNEKSFNDKAKACLGCYCYSNGHLVFVDHDGKTYLAKGSGLIPLLDSLGYKQCLLYVPFTHGEIITDCKLALRWKKLKEFK